MARLSNNLIVTLNFLSFLLSIPIISAGIWLAVQALSDCDKFLQWPVISVGAFLMLISLVGFIAACSRITWLLCLYLFVMFFLILVLLCFTVFAVVVTKEGAVGSKSDKEYRLGDYSEWFQKRMEKTSNWNKIRSCILDAKVCESLAKDSAKEAADAKLSPIQSGCCKPPSLCDLHYSNNTHWSPLHGATNVSKDGDCKKWSNDEAKLCYDCNSCRAGVVASVKGDWQNIILVDVVVLIALIIVHSIGCCAFKNDKRGYDRFGFKGYP